MKGNMKLIYIFTLALCLLCSSCATTGIKNIDNSNLNDKQSEVIAQEITLLIKQNYAANKYSAIALDSSSKNGQIIESKLRLAGYAIDKVNKNTNALPILTYHIKQDTNKIFIHIHFDNKMLNKAYILTANNLISTTPLTIIDLK